MILLTYQTPDGLALGAVGAHGVLDVKAAATALGDDAVAATPDALLRLGNAAQAPLAALLARAEAQPEADWFHDEGDLQLGPCVPNPGKIVCVGLNYLRHAIESGMEAPKAPVLFSKFNNSLAAANEDVPIPATAPEVDYEAELVAVIGRTAKNVSEEDALDYVFGYCNSNDISDRHLQFVSGQWLLGKTPDKFLPLGPYLVTADAVGDPQDLRVRCWVDGDLRQDSHTSDMIFGVAACISYISRHFTLEPGDIISTGTPEGVVLGRAQKDWLEPGNVITVEVEKLGRLTNTMVAGV
jgi:2-keto-4-pentenoate hydratase/2-oxohepta-3-ene-1,7-dioic acid hydratase in catechol pathway